MSEADDDTDNPNPSFSNSIDRLKESFLFATAKGGNAQDCEALLTIGADVNWRSQDDDTPLLAAVRKGHVETVQLLLAYGADCNVKGTDSLTPMHIAARRGDLNTMNVLLNGKANVNAKTLDGKTAYDVAKTHGYDDICQRIITHRHSAGSANPQAVAARSTNINTMPSEAKNLRSDDNGGPRTGSSSENRMELKVEGNAQSALSSLSTEAAAKLADDANANRPTSKAQDKRTDTGFVNENPLASSRTPAVAVTKDYSFVPAVLGSRTNSTTAPVKNTNGSRLSVQAHADQTNYIYELKSELDIKASEAEVLRVQLEEEMIGAHVAQKEAHALKEQLLDLKEHLLELTEELSLLRGEPEGLREVTTVAECAKVERYLKASLARIEEHKASLINKIVSDNLEDSRMCVVCQANEKSVVLLPCRHVCLCKECASNELVEDCPLCREKIRDRITVFL